MNGEIKICQEKIPIKILILGEGVNDVGNYNDIGQWIDGSIIKLLSKINDKIELIPIDKKQLPKTVAMKDRPSPQGHGKIIQKMMIYARTRKIEYEIMVYYGDTDKEANSKNTEVQARKASRNAYQQAHDAFELYEVKGIAIIPLRMLESWLLADEQAFFNAFSYRVTLPNKPELLWGDEKDPDSDHPKRALERVLSSIKCNNNTYSYSQIFENADIVVLERKCPISFSPFIQNARKYLG